MAIKRETEAELIDLATNYMSLYGINVNLARAIPMIMDGTKPIGKRTLFTMYDKFKDTKMKASVVIGEIMKLSPHGDLGMGDMIARMCQKFSNNVPLLDGHGNTGNPTTGNDMAAPRYFSISLSKFAKDVLFDEFDGETHMMLSYDESTYEPFVLPAKFPVILLNGDSGIGYTLSSNIYPHNLNELADATIKLIENPNAKIRLIPDLPTGCDIIVKDSESFIMQASYEIDNLNYIITFTNTPYGKYIDDIDKALRAIQDSPNPIPEIIAADDESDQSIFNQNKIKYVVRCKPCNLHNVVQTMFKRVPGLRATISERNMVVVDSSYHTRKYNMTQILCAWISDRLTEKRGYLLRELVKKNARCNLLEGKCVMLSPENLDKTIKIFRSCEEKDEIIPALMKGYKGEVSSSQANFVSTLHMYRLTKNEYKKTLEELENIREEINQIREIVQDKEKIKQKVIEEISEIKEKYGYKRRSKIINTNSNETTSVSIVQTLVDGSVIFSESENPSHLTSDVTPISGDSVCLIDDEGNFTWINPTKVQHDSPMTLTSIGKVPMTRCMAAVSNPDSNIIILTNHGRIKYMPISKIPSNATKRPLLPLNFNEKIVSILDIRDDGDDLLIYTNDGMGKRVPLSSLNKVMSIDAQGQFIMDADNVSGMFSLDSKYPLLVYVTRLGKVRVNKASFLVAGKKFADSKPIIPLSPQDDLIAVFCCNQDQKVTLNHVDSRVSTVNIDSLDVCTMAVQPIRPKHVPGVKVARATISR